MRMQKGQLAGWGSTPASWPCRNGRVFVSAILPQPTGEAVRHRPGSRTQCDGIRKPTGLQSSSSIPGSAGLPAFPVTPPARRTRGAELSHHHLQREESIVRN